MTAIRVREAILCPAGSATDAIRSALRSARDEIGVAVFSFASRPIADELVAASRRGVKVRVLVDQRSLRPGEPSPSSPSSTRSVPALLIEEGIAVAIYRAERHIFHTKLAVIDPRHDSGLAIVSTCNWDEQGLNRTLDSILFLDGRGMVEQIAAWFDRSFSQAQGSGAGGESRLALKGLGVASRIPATGIAVMLALSLALTLVLLLRG